MGAIKKIRVLSFTEIDQAVYTDSGGEEFDVIYTREYTQRWRAERRHINSVKRAGIEVSDPILIREIENAIKKQ